MPVSPLCLQHTDPDYSCAYVALVTQGGLVGVGHTFTLGRGTDIVCAAVVAIVERCLAGRDLQTVLEQMGAFWHQVASESQLRWVCPSALPGLPSHNSRT